MRTRLALAAVVLVALLGACGSDDDDPSTSATTSETTSMGAVRAAEITIEGFKFAPNPLTVKVGETISVTNKDGTRHSVQADDEKAFDTGEFSSGTKTFKVDTAGSYPYHCHVHETMKGVLEVQA